MTDFKGQRIPKSISLQMYGGVYNLFAKDLPKVGITSTLIVKSDADKIVQALTKKTKLVWLEVCSNPIMDIADLKLIVEKVKSFDKDIVVAVDNTYLSPYIIVCMSLSSSKSLLPML